MYKCGRFDRVIVERALSSQNWKLERIIGLTVKDDGQFVDSSARIA